MSTDNITPFLQKSRTDAALREQVNAIHEQADVAVAQALAGLSREVGLPFSAEEFLALQKTALSDDSLAGVAGGYCLGRLIEQCAADNEARSSQF